MGLGLIGIAEALNRLRQDVLVVLGDRYEAMAAAQAAMIARIPIAHIHGGEATEGVIDEAIRHSITKMAHLHFVAAEEYRQRVIQLGENPRNVRLVGAAGLDNVAKLPTLTKEQLESDLGLELKTPVFLVTYHPVTLRDDDSSLAMQGLLSVLDEAEGTIVITGANADTGGGCVRREAKRFAATRLGRVALVESLGAIRYLSLMRYTDVVVGNSSSGLLEAPAVGIPTVDIGERQSGRLRAPSVIHCSAAEDDIRAAVAFALTDEHRKVAAQRQTPYGTVGASGRIVSVLLSCELNGILQKKFYDISQQ